MNLEELYDARVRVAESLGFRAMTDVGQEQDLEQMLSRQDSRDAVVSVDPPALVEAAEQVNTDLTIGRGVGNAQSSAKRARTVNCSGTAPTSIDSYDKSLHDEMERFVSNSIYSQSLF